MFALEYYIYSYSWGFCLIAYKNAHDTVCVEMVRRLFVIRGKVYNVIINMSSVFLYLCVSINVLCSCESQRVKYWDFFFPLCVLWIFMILMNINQIIVLVIWEWMVIGMICVWSSYISVAKGDNIVILGNMKER